MAALESLVRVHKWVLNEKRQKLAALEELIARMRADVERLEADLEQEREAATENAAGTVAFPAFVAAAMERRKRQRRTIAELESAAEAARDEVHAAFQDLKAYEMARDKHEREEAERLNRQERSTLDELGLDMYRRGGGHGAGD